MKYEAIVIGASAGGMETLGYILTKLPLGFKVPILIVQHLSPQSDSYMTTYFNNKSNLNVKDADEKENIMPGTVYMAPPNYHLLVERNKTLSLTVCPKVNYARPSIDILFETASEAYGDKLIGVVLTGANSDGSKGLKFIKENGGLAIVQDPDTAISNSMPMAAINVTEVDYVLTIEKIIDKLIELVGYENEETVKKPYINSR